MAQLPKNNKRFIKGSLREINRRLYPLVKRTQLWGGPRHSAACGIFPDQGSNPCALHWQADSQPLRHQGSPRIFLNSSKVDITFIVEKLYQHFWADSAALDIISSSMKQELELTPGCHTLQVLLLPYGWSLLSPAGSSLTSSYDSVLGLSSRFSSLSTLISLMNSSSTLAENATLSETLLNDYV